MRRPYTQLSEKPKRFCTECKREVFQTVHFSESYWSDWYMTNNKVICVDCNKK